MFSPAISKTRRACGRDVFVGAHGPCAPTGTPHAKSGQGGALPLPYNSLCFLWRFCVFCVSPRRSQNPQGFYITHCLASNPPQHVLSKNRNHTACPNRPLGLCSPPPKHHHYPTPNSRCGKSPPHQATKSSAAGSPALNSESATESPSPLKGKQNAKGGWGGASPLPYLLCFLWPFCVFCVSPPYLKNARAFVGARRRCAPTLSSVFPRAAPKRRGRECSKMGAVRRFCVPRPLCPFLRW